MPNPIRHRRTVLLRLGAAAAAPPSGAPDPDYAWDHTGLYNDIPPTTPATAGQDVLYWAATHGGNDAEFGGGFSNAENWGGGTGGLYLLSDSSGSRLALDSSIALTGPFAIYVAGSRSTTTKIWLPLGNPSNAAILSWSDNGLYLKNDAGAQATLTTAIGTGNFLVAIIRDGSNQIYYAQTGSGALANPGSLSGTITFTHVGLGAGVNNESGCGFRAISIYEHDTVDAGQHAAIAAALETAHGVGLD